MIRRLFHQRQCSKPILSDTCDTLEVGDNWLELHDSTLFSEPTGSVCQEFLQRVFSVIAVFRVEIDSEFCTAEIGFHGDGVENVLDQLVHALTSENDCRDVNATKHLFMAKEPSTTFRVFRCDDTLTTWKIIHQIPGRMRVRHDQLRGHPKAANYLEDELKATFGVSNAQAKSVTGTVLICFDEEVIVASKLVRVIERMLCDLENPQQHGYVHPQVRTALCNTSLGLAVLANWAIPALLPLSGLIVTFSGLDYFRGAWRELLQKKIGPNVVYAAIVGGTLVSGYFVVAALMTWFMNFWDRTYHRRLSMAQRSLLANLDQRVRFIWVEHEGVEIEVPIEEVNRGDVVVVQKGDMIGVDGTVLHGWAHVDERLVCGKRHLAKKREGDPVFSRTIMLEGQLKIRASRVGSDTRSSVIRKMIEEASTPSPAPLIVRGAPFANRTAVPTLAMAGVGLLAGDLTTFLAILRLDYATGPGMTSSLGVLQDLHGAIRCGIVVRQEMVFGRMADVDVIVIDQKSWERFGGKDQTRVTEEDGNDRGLRGEKKRFPVAVGFVSEGFELEARRGTEKLGVDLFGHGLSDSGKAEVVRKMTQQGRRVLFVGDCRCNRRTAGEAYVALSLAEIQRDRRDEADGFLLQPNLESLEDLCRIIKSNHKQQRTDIGRIVLPNLFCVAGALLFGFTTLSSVIITNLAVYTVYRRGSRWLRQLESGGLKERHTLLSDYQGDIDELPARETGNNGNRRLLLGKNVLSKNGLR